MLWYWSLRILVVNDSSDTSYSNRKGFIKGTFFYWFLDSYNQIRNATSKNNTYISALLLSEASTALPTAVDNWWFWYCVPILPGWPGKTSWLWHWSCQKINLAQKLLYLSRTKVLCFSFCWAEFKSNASTLAAREAEKMNFWNSPKYTGCSELLPGH